MIKSVLSVLRSNIRFRLVVSLLSIVFLTGTLTIIIGLNIINKNVIRAAYDSVRTSLAAIDELYREDVARRSRTIHYLAQTSEIVRATSAADRATLHEALGRIRRDFGFDIVNVVDPQGTVLVRANNPDAFGDSMAHYRTIQEVLRTRNPVASTGVLDFSSIRNEGPELAERTRITVVPTPRARPRTSPVEDHAMVIKIAAPIMDGGRLTGILYAAVLLNNNTEVIDRFRRLVFKEEKLRGKDIGTTTIFLGDIRVATNVADAAGRRAIGTQVSEKVYQRVFEEGQVWVDNAFVVDSWYISGYSPIFDLDHKTLGILYVGILKSKYDLLVRDTALSFFLVIVVTTIIALILAGYLISTYTKPVKRLIVAAKELAGGAYHRIAVDPHDDDDARNLAQAFNGMVEAIEERDRELKEQAARTILRSEKLASIGRLASGVAHELNNPLTGVLTYGSLLLEDLKGTKYEDDLKVIRDETMRCRGIVRGLLDFARESRPERVLSDLNALVEDSLKILEKHVSFQNIEIVKALDRPLPRVSVDPQEIRTVINNLALNAADAMPNGGRLTIATSAEPQFGMVVITVADTGVGISEENAGKIFEPFFTTKEKGKGTGLGLAVTYGVIQRHGGLINLESRVGQGTKFTIKLPLR